MAVGIAGLRRTRQSQLIISCRQPAVSCAIDRDWQRSKLPTSQTYTSTVV